MPKGRFGGPGSCNDHYCHLLFMMKNVILVNNQTSIVLILRLVSQLIKNYGIFKAYLVSSLQNYLCKCKNTDSVTKNKYLCIYKDTFEQTYLEIHPLKNCSFFIIKHTHCVWNINKMTYFVRVIHIITHNVRKSKVTNNEVELLHLLTTFL